MPAKKPNFLVIIADDLGFSDIGCFGSEIYTPTLDKMAAEGVRFLDFHTASACSPTRSMLLSGNDNHIAGVGAMSEMMHDEEGRTKWRGHPGHEGYLNQRVAALPEILQEAGYHTLLTGKWHLGLTPDKGPKARGFDKSFSMLSGCSNHYAYEPQFQRDSEFPEVRFSEMVPAIYDKSDMYHVDGKRFDIPANFPIKDGGFYSTETFATQLLTYFNERKASHELKEKPFFAYLAFTAPHWPLQAPKTIRDKYRGMYDEGPMALRAARLERLKKMGLVDKDVKPHPIVDSDNVTVAWEKMNEVQKKKSSRAMETYSAMVECIDTAVGRVMDQLEEDGELDNTFVVFMSDNGAEGASYEAHPYFGESILNVLNTFYNNDLDNIGEPDSFAWYGSHWAQAATAPSRLYKMFTTEGGIRVPFIVRYPPLNGKPNFTPGSHNDAFSTVMDLAPTMLEIAGVAHPAREGQLGEFRGRQVEPMRGSSWINWIEGEADRVHDEGLPHGWELHGRAALRIGNWKIVWIPPPNGKGAWELFDLSKDPGETDDLALQRQDKMHELQEGWEEYVRSSGVVWGEPRNGEAQMTDETADSTAWMKATKH